MSGRLDGKVAIVTGSGQGIGRAIALSLAAEGASLVVNSRTEQSVDATTTAADVAREIESSGGTALPVFADVGTTLGAELVVNGALERYGRVDILVNNAGGGGALQEVGTVSEDEWDRVIQTNLKSQYACCHLAIPLMKQSSWGRIINVGSNVGLYGLPGMSAYAAAKAGSIGFTFSLAKETAASGITVNCLVPTATTTRSLRTRAQLQSTPGAAPASRDRAPEAIAPWVTFLCSDAAAGITGQVIYSAGGQITVYAWPPTPRTLYRDEQWSVDEIERLFPTYFGTDLQPPPLPRPLG